MGRGLQKACSVDAWLYISTAVVGGISRALRPPGSGPHSKSALRPTGRRVREEDTDGAVGRRPARDVPDCSKQGIVQYGEPCFDRSAAVGVGAGEPHPGSAAGCVLRCCLILVKCIPLAGMRVTAETVGSGVSPRACRSPSRRARRCADMGRVRGHCLSARRVSLHARTFLTLQ